jgi:hypothetical protein
MWLWMHACMCVDVNRDAGRAAVRICTCSLASDFMAAHCIVVVGGGGDCGGDECDDSGVDDDDDDDYVGSVDFS